MSEPPPGVGLVTVIVPLPPFAMVRLPDGMVPVMLVPELMVTLVSAVADPPAGVKVTVVAPLKKVVPVPVIVTTVSPLPAGTEEGETPLLFAMFGTG